MNKREIIQAFADGATKGEASNLKILGNNLINYNTVISHRLFDGVILNKTKYSQTTTRNQNMIRAYCNIIGEYEQNEFYNKFIY